MGSRQKFEVVIDDVATKEIHANGPSVASSLSASDNSKDRILYPAPVVASVINLEFKSLRNVCSSDPKLKIVTLKGRGKKGNRSFFEGHDFIQQLRELGYAFADSVFDLMSVKQAAKALNCSQATVDDYIAKGKLAVVEIHKRRRIERYLCKGYLRNFAQKSGLPWIEPPEDVVEAADRNNAELQNKQNSDSRKQIRRESHKLWDELQRQRLQSLPLNKILDLAVIGLQVKQKKKRNASVRGAKSKTSSGSDGDGARDGFPSRLTFLPVTLDPSVKRPRGPPSSSKLT